MIIGIDPGLQGGIALIDRKGLLIDAIQMPIRKVGTKNCIHTNRLYSTLREYIVSYTVNHIAIEYVHSMPKQGVASMFSFGFGYGLVIATCHCLGLEPDQISPRSWKNYFKLKYENKEAGLLVVEKLYPNTLVKFETPRGRLLDGIVDAVLIAKYKYDQIKKESKSK